MRLRNPTVARKVLLDEKISQRLDEVLASSRQTLSSFVQDAIVQRLARWEPAEAFIDRKRKKLGHRKQSGFDLSKVHECGWPLKTPDAFWKLGNRPDDEVKNLRALLQYASATAKSELHAVWQITGLGTYSDKEWAITQAWWMENKDTVHSTAAATEEVAQ